MTGKAANRKTAAGMTVAGKTVAGYTMAGKTVDGKTMAGMTADELAAARKTLACRRIRRTCIAIRDIMFRDISNCTVEGNRKYMITMLL